MLTNRSAARSAGLVVVALTLTACTAVGAPASGRPAGSTSRAAASATPGTTAPTPTPSPLPSAAPDACARSTLARLDLPGQVGQVLMVGLPVGDPVPGYSGLQQFRIGNVFLAGRSGAGAEQLRAATSRLQAQAIGLTGTYLQIAVDQEGGNVQTLTGPGFAPIPIALDQVAEPDLGARTGAWSAQLAQAGITLDLAPVADTVPAGTAAQNPPIGASSRQFGSDPGAVADAVSTVVRAMLGSGLGTTVKHFPGLGRVRLNTDTSTGAVDDRAGPGDPFLQPFRAAVDAGTTAVMVSSASYPGLDPDRLAAFSAPIVTDLLKGTLGFTGMVLSDDLGNAVAVSGRPPGQRAVDFVAAGGDLVLTVDAADAGPMTAALIARAGRDPAFASRTRDAALRVLRSKQDAGLLVC